MKAVSSEGVPEKARGEKERDRGRRVGGGVKMKDAEDLNFCLVHTW